MDAIHTLLPRVLPALFRNGPMSQAKLEAAWRAAVGEALSRVTTVRLVSGGGVEVHTADLRWQKELKRSTPMILGRLTALVGADAITHITVK